MPPIQVISAGHHKGFPGNGPPLKIRWQPPSFHSKPSEMVIDETLVEELGSARIELALFVPNPQIHLAHIDESLNCLIKSRAKSATTRSPGGLRRPPEGRRWTW